MNKKPTVDEIKEQYEKDKKVYGIVQGKWAEDEKYYNLDFLGKLNIPTEFAADKVVLPTARDVVDTAVNHTDINNARVYANKKSTSDMSKENAEMLRKFALGLIHRTNVEAQIAPGHVGAKHYWIHGLAVYKTVWDADRWLDKPEWKEGESEDAYNERLDKWRATSHLSLPIVIQAINPANIMPDPYTGGNLYVFEIHTRSLFDTRIQWPNWTNPLGKTEEEPIEYISWWNNQYRCEMIDGEPIKKVGGGVWKHKYGFIPYTLIESGLGNLSKDAKPEDRYVGLLRMIFDLLVSESTNYTLNDILMKRETMKGGYITGGDANDMSEVKQAYGKYWPVGNKDVEFHDWDVKMPPQSSMAHLGITHDYISGHAAPRAVRGLSETGVRSGADRRLIMTEAAAIYRYATPAFAHGWANILTKCAMLVKNVIPGDFDIWARTPTDEFDVPVKKNKFREPFNFYVEFAPISEEDEYRRHDDLERLVTSGIVTKSWARKQMSNVDGVAMDKEEEKERLKLSPAYNQIKDQYLALRMNEVLGVVPQVPPGQEGVVPGTPQGEAGRRMVPGIPNRAQPGSAGALQNQMAQMRSPTATTQQGQGGGGQR